MDYTTRQEAERLAQLGYRVFPCIPNSKSPATAHGCLDATTDADQIDDWFGDSNYNLAISTDGLLVIDVDPVDGLPNPWLTPERALELGTVSAVTPRGGRHYWFRQPDGANIRNTTSRIAPGVDTRANGGYVLVSPSATEHGSYRWLDGAELDCPPGKLPLPPPWLMAMLTDRPKAEPQQTTYATGSEQIPEGKRNSTLTSIAGYLRRAGLSQRAAEVALQQINHERCKPPLDGDEVRKIAASVSRYEPSQSHQAVAEGWAEQDRRRAAQSIRVLTLSELKTEFPRQREPIIEGLCRPGEVVNVIAKSKVGKSWTTYGLAFSVITAQPWLGKFGCRSGKVLLVDNELLPETLANRLGIVQRKLDIPDSVADNLHAVSLRGNNLDIYGIGSLLNEDIQGRYAVIVLDCFYKFLPAGISENDNAAMGQVYCELERYAALTNAVIVVVHHATKGSQDGKDVVDVGSGASALSRSADSHVILRPHEEPGCVVMESAVRSFPPNDPVVLRFEFPLWLPVDGLNPDALQDSKTAKENAKKAERLEAKRQAIVEFLAEADVAKVGATRSAIRDNTGGNGSLMEAIRSLLKDKIITAVAVLNPANGISYDGWKLTAEDQQADSRTAGGFSESSACPGRGGSVSDGQLLRNSVRLPPELPPDGSEAKENCPAARRLVLETTAEVLEVTPEDAADNLKPNGTRRNSKKPGKARKASA